MSLLAVFTSPPNTASLSATFEHASATQSEWVYAWMLASTGVQYDLGCRRVRLRSMMSAAFEWTRSRTTQFITAFYIHPCLWKIKSSDYKNKILKQTAAKSVQAEMGKKNSNFAC